MATPPAQSTPQKTTRKRNEESDRDCAPKTTTKRTKKEAPAEEPVKPVRKNPARSAMKTRAKAESPAPDAFEAPEVNPPPSTPPHGKEAEAPEPEPKPEARPKRKSGPRQKRKAYDPDRLLTDPKGLLARANLTKFFAKPCAWGSLSYQQQLELIKMLPETPKNKELIEHIEKTNGCVERPKELMTTTNLMKTDIARFSRDLRLGQYNKKWQEDASEAMKTRATGVWDEWKERECERFWGQKFAPDNVSKRARK